jgi:hypothetical protein
VGRGTGGGSKNPWEEKFKIVFSYSPGWIGFQNLFLSISVADPQIFLYCTRLIKAIKVKKSSGSACIRPWILASGFTMSWNRNNALNAH